jgi:hypothetical protein
MSARGTPSVVPVLPRCPADPLALLLTTCAPGGGGVRGSAGSARPPPGWTGVILRHFPPPPGCRIYAVLDILGHPGATVQGPEGARAPSVPCTDKDRAMHHCMQSPPPPPQDRSRSGIKPETGF